MNSLVHLRMGNAFRSPKEILHACIRDNDVAGLRREIESSNGKNILDHGHPEFGTPLNVAVWCDNLAAVIILVNAGADPLAETPEEGSISPLMLAIRNGQRSILQRLWARLPPESHANGTQPFLSCLYQAAVYGQASLVGDLLIWWDGWTVAVKEEALFAAANRWHIHVVDLLLTRLIFPRNILVQALHMAAGFKFMMGEEERSDVHYDGVDYLNQQRLITRLIDAGADPNALYHGQHVIFVAASAVDLGGGLKALLDKGADPNAKNHQRTEQSALQLLSSPIPIRQQLNSDSRLHETGIRLLLQHGARVLQADAAGNTPLHRAAFGADVRIFQLYLSTLTEEDQGVILNIKNLQRETPLHWAAAGGKIDILEYLLFRGLDANAKSANGWTPLVCALSPTLKHQFHDAQAKQPWEAIQAAQLLLFHGADPLVSTAEGWTPLHCLARYQDGDDRSDLAQLAKQLILCGADIEARATMLCQGNPMEVHPKKAVSLLRHCEFAWGSEVQEIIELTVGKRGFIRPGLTPLHCAAEHGALGVAKALLSYGADASVKNPSGTTPAQMADQATLLPASLRLNEKLVQLFIEAGGT